MRAALWGIFAVLACATVCFSAPAGPVQTSVPVYIEDNHAGAFYWLAQNLDLNQGCTLVHFDAHSDASALFDSDIIREKIRRVASTEDRGRMLDEWRAQGRIQCFDWMEPLMPVPICNVVWVPAEHLYPEDIQKRNEEAAGYLDGQLEASPRRAGPLKSCYHVSDLAGINKWIPEGQPVVITIDLDYFAGMQVVRNVAFERVWSFVTGCRNLRAVVIAISRPYLTSNEESHHLVELALRSALSLPTAVIEYEPFLSTGEDHSLRAKELHKKGLSLPSYHIEDAPETLRATILANRARIHVQNDVLRWDKILDAWSAETPQFRLALKGRQPSTDGIWRVPVSESAEVEVLAEPWYASPDEVSWVTLQPCFTSCNLLASSDKEDGFARGAPPRPRWREQRIESSGSVLDLNKLASDFDPGTECGSVRIQAKIKIGGHLRETPPIEIRRYSGTGLRAAITEQFGLPYLFGSGELRSDTDTGPESGWGADCANFIVYAMRRQGMPVPWCDPKKLRGYLEPVAEGAMEGQVKFSPEDLENGLIVHLGTHVAVVMKDQPPFGVLDANVLVAHQLNGMPEIIPLGKLLKDRGTDRFDVLRIPTRRAQPELLVGGDVMLGRTVGRGIESGANPFAAIQSLLNSASTTLVNLECVISDQGTSAPATRYPLRAPASSSELLRKAGISFVGLANNHSEDFGPEALLDTIDCLKLHGIGVLGAGPTMDQAFASQIVGGGKESRIALLAVDDTTTPGAAGDLNRASIANASDKVRIAAAVTAAHENSNLVVCLVHWGDENTSEVNGRQRELARWLIDHGVNVVVGAHPHCIQPMDAYHGSPIAYSLGNLVFDGASSVASWKKGELLEIGFSGPARLPWWRIVPIELNNAGFPQVPQ